MLKFCIVVIFINIAKPATGLYNLPRSYFDLFRSKQIHTEWINLQWDKNIKYEGATRNFLHVLGSGYILNSLLNAYMKRFNLNDVAIYTTPNIMPEDNGKAISIIHDFFYLTDPAVSEFDKWKNRKVIAFIKKKKIGVITNSEFVASESRRKNLRVISPLYPYINHIYNGEEKDRKMILSIGTNRIRKKPKNIVLFVNSLPEGWKFVRIGDDLNLVGKINTKADYIYERYVEFPRLLSYYNKASYLYFPSEEEGIGLPMIEALFHNVAVIGNKDNKIFDELKLNDSISIQDINAPYIPDYPDLSSFQEFRSWFKERIEQQFAKVKEEIDIMGKS